MIQGLHPYETYTEFPEPWLGQIPSDWRAPRFKTVFRETTSKGHPHEPLLAATQTRGVILKSRYGARTVTAQKGLDTLKLVEVGDFVVSLRSFEGGIELAHDRGIISPAYTVLRPHDDRYTGYLRWLLKSVPFVQSLNLHVTGIREGQTIDYVRLGRSRVPIPSPSEAVAIDRFLSSYDVLVWRYIRARQRLVFQLAEGRQATISIMTNRGLLGEYRARVIADVVSGALDVREAAGRLQVNIEDFKPHGDAVPDDDPGEAGSDDGSGA